MESETGQETEVIYVSSFTILFSASAVPRRCTVMYLCDATSCWPELLKAPHAPVATLPPTCGRTHANAHMWDLSQSSGG